MEESVEYIISAVNKSRFAEGHADVWLSPVEELPKPVENGEPAVISNNVPGMPPGMEVVLQQFMPTPEKIQQMMGKNRSSNERDILLVIGNVDLEERGWKYGDRIEAVFRKKKGKD